MHGIIGIQTSWLAAVATWLSLGASLLARRAASKERETGASLTHDNYYFLLDSDVRRLDYGLAT